MTTDQALARDVWHQAFHVRMWLMSALESTRLALECGIVVEALTRGAVGRAHVDDALTSVRQAALALIELEYAQHRAQLDRVQLSSTQVASSRNVKARALADSLVADIATLDALAAAVEVLQRPCA